MQLGSHVAVAVAVAGGNSSYLTPSLETSMCCRCGPKKDQNKKKMHVSDVPDKACATYFYKT